ncbi:hypothetical protein Tco_0397605 [Tanacetum coccineum]
MRMKERLMNIERASDPDKKRKFVKEDVLTKVPAKPDVAEQGTKKRKGGHMKMLARKRKRPQPDVDILARLNKVSSPDGDYLVIYRANGNFRVFNYLMEIVRWRLYEACGVYILELEDGTIIHMLVERRYPLSKELLQRMLDFGLEVEGSHSPCFMLILGSPRSTVLVKDYSNMLIADSLLKTIWFINAPCYGNEALASPKANELTIPEQTATGKGKSNPFMAGSLPKTTKPT